MKNTKIVKRAFLNFLLVFIFHLPGDAQKPLGLQLYTFRKEMANDVPGTLQKIHQMGIRYIEGGSLYGMSADEFKQLLKKNSLIMVSFGANFNELDSNVKQVAERAKVFNAQFVICTWIPHNGTEFGINEINKSIEVFNRAGKYLKSQGLQFCYHPHGYEFRPYQNGTLFDELVRKTNPSFVNFEMDVFWAKNGGAEPVALLKKYPNRFPLFHLKDRRKGTEGNQNGTADEETNVVFGEGDVNIAGIKKEAMKLKTVKYFFIEDESSRAMEQVPKSVAYWNSLK